MYVVKNTGAMVIGVSDGLQAGDHELKSALEGPFVLVEMGQEKRDGTQGTAFDRRQVQT